MLPPSYPHLPKWPAPRARLTVYWATMLRPLALFLLAVLGTWAHCFHACAQSTGDANSNDVIDASDFYAVASCLTGPGVIVGPSCAVFSVVDPARVDVRSALWLQGSITTSIAGIAQVTRCTTWSDASAMKKGRDYVGYNFITDSPCSGAYAVIERKDPTLCFGNQSNPAKTNRFIGIGKNAAATTNPNTLKRWGQIGYKTQRGFNDNGTTLQLNTYVYFEVEGDKDDSPAHYVKVHYPLPPQNQGDYGHFQLLFASTTGLFTADLLRSDGTHEPDHYIMGLPNVAQPFQGEDLRLVSATGESLTVGDRHSGTTGSHCWYYNVSWRNGSDTWNNCYFNTPAGRKFTSVFGRSAIGVDGVIGSENNLQIWDLRP